MQRWGRRWRALAMLVVGVAFLALAVAPSARVGAAPRGADLSQGIAGPPGADGLADVVATAAGGEPTAAGEAAAMSPEGVAADEAAVATPGDGVGATGVRPGASGAETPSGEAEAQTAAVDPKEVVPLPTEAEAEAAEAADEAAKVAELCGDLVAAADAHDVPHEFFIRLIWKESRFNPRAVSPVGAQGIAQFMPATARLRGLADPFDRRTALEASASFLADLRSEFGSWGLAAAGYNGGPNRLPAFIAGEAGLPYETIDYVFDITGRSAGYWAVRARARLARGERSVREPQGWIGNGMPEGPALAFASAVAATDETAAAAPVADAEAGTGTADTAAASEAASETVAPADAAAATPALPPTLTALARLPFATPLPRARPDRPPAAVDCTELIGRLGRSRAVTPPSTGGGWSPWGAQVAGHVRREVAMRQYDRLKVRLPGDLAAAGPRVVVRRFAARGRFPVHAVQFAAGTRAEAEALCARIARIRAPCVVVRNG